MEDQFSNEQVHIPDLPTIATLDLSPLHKEYLSVAMIGNLITWLIIGGSVLTIWFFKKDEWPNWLSYGIPILLGTLIIMSFSLAYFGFKRKKYALRERDILYQTGLIWRAKTVIPFNRIQHAEVSQGPIERMFGLSVLRIFTAGGSTSDMRIPGLTPEIAQNIKEFVLGKTASDEEE